jgi:hypothetical protein
VDEAAVCSPHPAATAPVAPTAGWSTSTRPLAEVPAALRILLDPDPPTTTRPAGTVGAAVPGHPYGRRVLADELATLGRATPGQRNHTLNRTAFKVYRYVAGGILDDQDVTVAFTTAALAIGLDRAEIGRTLPRPAPPAWPTPHHPDPTRRQPPGGRPMTGRWTYRTSAAGVIILAAAAFTLSYDALHQLALDSRVRPALAWLWPVVIVGTIVVALLTVLAAKRAATRAGYPWMLAGLFSAASVAFNIAHAPDRPIAQLVFAMAPVALVLTTPAHAASHLAPRDDGLTEPMPAPEAGPEPAQPHTLADQPAQPPAPADQRVPAGARARVRAAYEAHVQAGQTPSGAGLARAAGVSERYGQRLLAEFTTEPGRPGHRNGDGQPGSRESNDADAPRSKGGGHG